MYFHYFLALANKLIWALLQPKASLNLPGIPTSPGAWKDRPVLRSVIIIRNKCDIQVLSATSINTTNNLKIYRGDVWNMRN